MNELNSNDFYSILLIPAVMDVGQIHPYHPLVAITKEEEVPILSHPHLILLGEGVSCPEWGRYACPRFRLRLADQNEWVRVKVEKKVFT